MGGEAAHPRANRAAGAWFRIPGARQRWDITRNSSMRGLWVWEIDLRGYLGDRGGESEWEVCPCVKRATGARSRYREAVGWCMACKFTSGRKAVRPDENRAAGAQFCALGTKYRWAGVQGSRIWWATVSDGAGGASVDGFARGRGGWSPRGKSGRQGSVFDWGWLSPTGMGLGSPK